MKTRLILGFPGVGKTTYVKEQNDGIDSIERKTVDLDIEGPKPMGGILNNAMGDLVNTYLKMGCEVLTFLGYFNPDRIPPTTEIVVVHPRLDEKDLWIERIIERQGEGHFVDELRKNYEKWLENWINLPPSFNRFKNITKYEITSQQFLSQVLEFHNLIKEEEGF